MYHYGMSWKDVIAMPIKVFWILNRNINRVLAEMDLRQISVGMTVTKADLDGLKKTEEMLTKEMGQTFVLSSQSPMTATLDREGLAALKGM